MQNPFYYQQAGQRIGPVTWDALKTLVFSGRLAPADLVWQEGMPAWVRASEVPGLVIPPPGPLSSAAPISHGVTNRVLRDVVMLSCGVVGGALITTLLFLVFRGSSGPVDPATGKPLDTSRPENRVVGAWHLEKADWDFLGGVKEEKGPAFLRLEFAADGSWKTLAVDVAGKRASKTEPLSAPHLLKDGSGTWKFGRSHPEGMVLNVAHDSDLKSEVGWTVVFLPEDRIQITGGMWDIKPVFKRVK